MDIHLILMKTLQLLCCLSLLVVLHEGGHFMFSKLFKVRVEKFYMFFNPKFHLFSTKDKWFAKLFPRIAKNETEYGIGWIPLGGYVKIAGMIDESMDKEQMKQPAKPDEFRSQPVWKRFFIMFGGVLMNFITAVVIYCCIMLCYGLDVVPIQSVQNGFCYNQEAKSIGFKDGDIPVATDGEEIRYCKQGLMPDKSQTQFLSDPVTLQKIAEAKVVTVLRDGKKVNISMPETMPNYLDLLDETPPFLAYNIPAVVDSVLPNTAASKCGIKAGSRIVALENNKVDCWNDFDSLRLRKNDCLAAAKTHADSLKVRNTQIVCALNGKLDTFNVVLDENLKSGIIRSDQVSFTDYCKVEHQSYNVLTCIPAGFKYGCEKLVSYVCSLKYIFTKKGAKSVGSFISIGSIFPDTWDWFSFWHLTALISIILAVMNILPIPGLDGGHIMFLMFEAITRKPMSEKAQTVAEYIGMGLLILLMVWAFGNDLMKFVF